MARYTQDAGLNQPLDVVSDVMEQYLYQNRYVRADWKGELVYLSADAAKGDRYLVWGYTSGILHIEAWLKGSFNNEVGLTGAGSKKRAYRASINNLIETLRHPVKDEFARPNAVYQTQKTTQSYTPPATSKIVYTESWMEGKQSGTSNPTGSSFSPRPSNAFEPYVSGNQEERDYKARRGFIFGIIAIVGAFVLPILGLIFGIVGLGNCREGAASDMADKARLGKILCIVAIVWSFMEMMYYIIILAVGISVL